MSTGYSQAIEVDEQLGSDSNYESSDYGSSTESLASSINEYLIENGRKYHKHYGMDKNLMPTDEAEQERLDMTHEAYRILRDGEIYRAPLPKEVHRVLDVGTGTGIWAVEFAEKHQSAEVIGIDISPIQPNWVPPNCRFEVDDAELPWTFKSGSFDYIHMRNLAQSITKWDFVLQEAFRNLRPGGWIELDEVGLIPLSDDNTLPADDPMTRCFALLVEALDKIGRPSPTTELLVSRLEKAGFVDVRAFKNKNVFAPWAKSAKLKQVGYLNLVSTDSQGGYEAYALAPLTRILGWSAEDATNLCKLALKSHKDPKKHSYNDYYEVIGRKPE